MNAQAETHLESIDEIFSLKQQIRELEQSWSGEYFKAIIENSSDIILIVDKLGTITYARTSIERFLGYRSIPSWGSLNPLLLLKRQGNNPSIQQPRADVTGDMPTLVRAGAASC